VDKFAAAPFDLVFMDMQMPEMDGIEATRLIRQHQETTGIRVPIVAMTAHAMVGDREKCLAAGMDDYISKPISRDELTVVIARNSSGAPHAAQSPASSDSAPLSSADRELIAPKPPPVPVPAEFSINEEDLLSRFGGNRQLLQSVAEMFPDESANLIVSLLEARTANKPADVQMTAHTLKGMLKMFGTSPAAEIAAALEAAGAAGELGTDSQVDLLREEVARVTEAVKNLHQTLSQ